MDGGTGRHAALKMLWTNVRAGSIPAPTTTRPLSIFIKGFFVFVNIYLYICIMKNPLENLTDKELNELLTKTDVPMKWELDKIFKVKTSDKPNKNKTDN